MENFTNPMLIKDFKAGCEALKFIQQKIEEFGNSILRINCEVLWQPECHNDKRVELYTRMRENYINKICNLEELEKKQAELLGFQTHFNP